MKIPLIAQLVVKAFIQRPVTVHVLRGGGSFGRKLYPDAAIEAALTSAAIGKPVKLMWTRDDDLRHGRMRPATHHRIRFTYLGDTVYTLENWSSSVQLDVGFNPFISELLNGVPLPITGAGIFLATETTPYDFGASQKWLKEVFLNIPTGMWRGFFAGHNGAAEEIMVDRLAGQLGKDPLQLRIDLATEPESTAVLRELKSRAGWGRAMPPGHAQGVAFHRAHNSHVGCLVELDTTDRENPRVTKAVLVADVGRVINPAGARAQLMGGLIDGISTILQAGNHLRDGAIVESSFADFRYARQKHAPLQFDVHFVNTERESGGMGELGVGAASGAVANAYARATGTSPSTFPILA